VRGEQTGCSATKLQALNALVRVPSSVGLLQRF